MIDPNELERAWPAAEPPAGFSERVVARALREKRRFPIRRVTIAAALAAVAALALFVSWPATMPSGQRTASAREQIAIGERATAVLEPAARIAWQGETVHQSEGDVFYRVEPGSRFVVHTPAGEVSVLGTCFRVRVRAGTPREEKTTMKRPAIGIAAGAAISALAVISVYEGKVRLSHAGQDLELGPGQSGKLDGKGPGALDGAELEAAESALASADRADYAQANDELAKDIGDLNRRLRNLEKEKQELQTRLASAQERLAAADGGLPRQRSEFDLDQNDWATLAKDGTVKYRVPCFRPQGFKPSDKLLDALGLAPDDGPLIESAYAKSNQRVWQTVRKLCAQALGNDDVVDTLGADTCTHVVVDMAKKQDGKAHAEAMRQVAEIRAGQRPEPPAGSPMHPVIELFLALTGELPRFEADLAESFGPEEAHRLAYSEDMCASHSTFGGPGPRTP